MRNRIYVSWNQVVFACGVLTRKLLADHVQYVSVFAVARGGLVPASVLAYELGLPITKMITKHDILNPLYMNSLGGMIIVDDICETGKTFTMIKQMYPSATLVAPFVKESGKLFCQHWGCSYKDDDWLVFPWAPNDEINR